tara:strand:- start:481 stop:696 length:216 start_codon:yes stop_codon:yes gene_type:complete
MAVKKRKVKSRKTRKKAVAKKVSSKKAKSKATKSKKDACYYKAKAAHKVFPSAYASGMIAKCRKKRGGKKK